MIAQNPPAPIAAVSRIGDPGVDNPDICVGPRREVEDRAQIALEVSSGNAEPRIEVTVRADAPIEPQRRNNLSPIGPDRLRYLGQDVGDRNRGNETAIDADLRQFRALVA